MGSQGERQVVLPKPPTDQKTHSDLQAPIGGWAKDARLKQIGQFAQAALEQDYEGYVLFMANMVLGWTKEEVTVYCAQLRREIRSGKFHPFYRQRVVYGRKPE